MPPPARKPAQRKIQNKRIKKYFLALEKQYGTARAREIINRIGQHIIASGFRRPGFEQTDQQVMNLMAKHQNEIIEMEKRQKNQKNR